MTDTGEDIDPQMGSITTENPVSINDQLNLTLDDPQDTPEGMDHVHSHHQNSSVDSTQKDQQDPSKDTSDNNQLDQTYTVQESKLTIHVDTVIEHQTDLTSDNNQDNQTPNDPSVTQNSTARKNQQSETRKQLNSDNSVSEKDTDQQEVIILRKKYILIQRMKIKRMTITKSNMERLERLEQEYRRFRGW